jgi:hypothetical protein
MQNPALIPTTMTDGYDTEDMDMASPAKQRTIAMECASKNTFGVEDVGFSNTHASLSLSHLTRVPIRVSNRRILNFDDPSDDDDEGYLTEDADNITGDSLRDYMRPIFAEYEKKHAKNKDPRYGHLSMEDTIKFNDLHRPPGFAT